MKKGQEVWLVSRLRTTGDVPQFRIVRGQFQRQYRSTISTPPRDLCEVRVVQQLTGKLGEFKHGYAPENVCASEAEAKRRVVDWLKAIQIRIQDQIEKMSI